MDSAETKLLGCLGNLKELRKSTAYSYEYEYFNLNEKGNLTKNKKLNKTLGNSRAGFENFKQNNEVKPQGKISLREIIIDSEVQGYVKETAIKVDNSHEENHLYNQAFSYFTEAVEQQLQVEVQDEESLKFFCEMYSSQKYDFSCSIINDVEFLVDLLDEIEVQSCIPDSGFMKLLLKVLS